MNTLIHSGVLTHPKQSTIWWWYLWYFGTHWCNAYRNDTRVLGLRRSYRHRIIPMHKRKSRSVSHQSVAVRSCPVCQESCMNNRRVAFTDDYPGLPTVVQWVVRVGWLFYTGFILYAWMNSYPYMYTRQVTSFGLLDPLIARWRTQSIREHGVGETWK